MDITFGPLTLAALGLEPLVLVRVLGNGGSLGSGVPLGPLYVPSSCSQGDVRRACTLRTQFLQNLLIPQAKGGNIP